MKKVVSCVLFCALVLIMLMQMTEFLTPKAQNRYFILEKYLEANPEQNEHDVQVFGSCHSYTSFNPIYLEARTGVSAFVYGNAGEIIPTTYVRMVDQFKKYTPKVALVEIWGINPYETYSSHSRVFGFYLANNLERTPFSLEKLEVIRDFETIDYVSMNFPLVTYKERLMDGSLNANDFNYTFESTKPYSTKYMFSEMTSRLALNGFKKNPSKKIEDYPSKQKYIEEGEFKEIEPDIVKYIQKIIDLCKDKGVKLIFYRSPYTSKVNELKKLNHLQQICDENNVQFFDLEAELDFSYTTDFIDYQHLSEIGANKATEFLAPYVLEALKERGEIYENPSEDAVENLLGNSDFTKPENSSGQTVFVKSGYTVDNWRTNFSTDRIEVLPEGIKTTLNTEQSGWHLHQIIGEAENLAGKSLTAVFQIADFEGEKVRPIISCRDAEDKEILAATGIMEEGVLTVSCVVPDGTETVRVGFYGYKESQPGDYFIVESAKLYEGAYTLEILPMKQ